MVDRTHVLGARALGAAADFVLDLLADLQVIELAIDQRGDVEEHVSLLPLGLDKAKTLVRHQLLDGTLRHATTPQKARTEKNHAAAIPAVPPAATPGERSTSTAIARVLGRRSPLPSESSDFEELAAPMSRKLHRYATPINVML